MINKLLKESFIGTLLPAYADQKIDVTLMEISWSQ
jgi:hypothetical protein